MPNINTDLTQCEVCEAKNPFKKRKGKYGPEYTCKDCGAVFCLNEEEQLVRIK